MSTSRAGRQTMQALRRLLGRPDKRGQPERKRLLRQSQHSASHQQSTANSWAVGVAPAGRAAMRRAAAALAARLAAGSLKTAAPAAAVCSQIAAGRGAAGTAAAAATAAAVLATGAQWGLADAPHPAREQQPAAEQQQGKEGEPAECPTCPDVALEEQPVAISNSATAQVRPAQGLGQAGHVCLLTRSFVHCCYYCCGCHTSAHADAFACNARPGCSGACSPTWGAS